MVGQDNMNESSFFKGIINVEKSGATTSAEDQIKLEENQALREINEQNLKKIQEL